MAISTGIGDQRLLDEMMRRKAKTQEEASSRLSQMAMPVVEFGFFDPIAGY